MRTKKEIIEQLTGRGIVSELHEYLEQNFSDFSDIHRRYMCAIETLKRETSDDDSSAVDCVVNAIESQVASTLFFSGILGLKANWYHFVNPMANTVLNVDFDVFLREDTARRLPEYEKAQHEIDRFTVSLLPSQMELYEDIIEYISYLETIGPKIAHYYGYLLGNEIFGKIAPGYYPDSCFTMQYGSMLKDYLGKQLRIY